MEVDRIQLGGVLRVDRSGGEQQRRRRQENPQEFAEELQEAEAVEEHEMDSHVPASTELPASIDLVSLSLSPAEGAATAETTVPSSTGGGAYGLGVAPAVLALRGQINHADAKDGAKQDTTISETKPAAAEEELAVHKLDRLA
jgi:hypothetical protein